MSSIYLEFCGIDEEYQYYICLPNGIPGPGIVYRINDVGGETTFHTLGEVVDLREGVIYYHGSPTDPDIVKQERIVLSTRERFLTAIGAV